MSRWHLDPVHSSVQVSARHMMVSNVRGMFRDFSLEVDFDPEHPEQGRVQAIIQAASIDTGAAARDAHLRSADFLDAERFPTLIFRSTGVEPRSGDEYRLHGELTVRGETRPAVLEAEYLGVAHNLQGGTSAGFSAHTKLSRKDWGLTWNMGLEAGGLVVSDEIRVDIDLELLSPVPEQVAPEVQARTGVA